MSEPWTVRISGIERAGAADILDARLDAGHCCTKAAEVVGGRHRVDQLARNHLRRRSAARTSTVGAWPVTVSDSSSGTDLHFRVDGRREIRGQVDTVVSYTAVEKPDKLNLIEYETRTRSTIVYRPWPSVASGAGILSIGAGLDASTDTPGSRACRWCP